jgi:hypothetical protein
MRKYRIVIVLFALFLLVIVLDALLLVIVLDALFLLVIVLDALLLVNEKIPYCDYD